MISVARGNLLSGQQSVHHTILPRLVPWRGHSNFASQLGNNTGSSRYWNPQGDFTSGMGRTQRTEESMEICHSCQRYTPLLHPQQMQRTSFISTSAMSPKKYPPRIEDEDVLILGDFSVRVGADHDSWPSCLGHFGVGKINKNGQCLLEFCSYNGLCVMNSYFQAKPQHKVSWHHPSSKHWHQLDMILI
ncbi:uncharacterized protein LOC119571206 [Penaeus monodon]|uniref:uncharacterized protein LOC119571206 n=1 Tax=Penaeus monodon TaxID=6687 RepID=UPI0018A7450C|nr:uncharacterized protein LOC119571206 [Penaeus monodon]